MRKFFSLEGISFPLIVLALYWAELVYQLGAQWSAYEQYNYGWAVPALCLYLFWRRLGRFNVGNSEACPVVSEKGRRGAADKNLVLFVLFFCLLLYVPTRLLHEANPIWRLTSLAWTLEVIGITLCVLCLAAEGGEKRTEIFTRPVSALGPRFQGLVFPVCFFLVAVPWPTDLEALVIQGLTRLNVASTIELAGWLGVPALQHGNLIELANGTVGIDEACSGIRSIQATLMISLFFGEFYRLSPFQRLLCAASGFLFSFAFNVIRTTLLTWVASKKGVGAVSQWHDPAGVVILLGCFISLWLLAFFLSGRKINVEAGNLEGVRSNSEGVKTREPASSTLHLAFPRGLMMGLFVWFLVVEGGTETWFRLHERSSTQAGDWKLRLPEQAASFQFVELSPKVHEELKFDEGMGARWAQPDGSFWQTFDLKWNAGRSVYDRARISLSKSHNPEICLQASGMKMRRELAPVSIQAAPNLVINFHRYIFESEGRVVHVYFSVAEAMKASGSPGYLRMNSWDRIGAALAGSRNFGEHTLEIAVSGIEDPRQADAAVETELRKIIVKSGP